MDSEAQPHPSVSAATRGDACAARVAMRRFRKAASKQLMLADGGGGGLQQLHVPPGFNWVQTNRAESRSGLINTTAAGRASFILSLIFISASVFLLRSFSSLMLLWSHVLDRSISSAAVKQRPGSGAPVQAETCRTGSVLRSESKQNLQKHLHAVRVKGVYGGQMCRGG